MNDKFSAPWRIVATTCLALLLACQTVTAIPADPAPKRVKQADGTYITVVMRGDEHGHACFAVDGTPLRYNRQTGMMEQTTREKAWVAGMTTKGALSRVARYRRDEQQQDGEPYIHPLINHFPTHGSQKTLVLLLEFSDLKFTSISDPKAFYTRMLNEEGFTYENGANGSARDFYRQTSMEQFDPEFVVAGPILLPKEAT